MKRVSAQYNIELLGSTIKVEHDEMALLPNGYLLDFKNSRLIKEGHFKAFEEIFCYHPIDNEYKLDLINLSDLPPVVESTLDRTANQPLNQSLDKSLDKMLYPHKVIKYLSEKTGKWNFGFIITVFYSSSKPYNTIFNNKYERIIDARKVTYQSIEGKVLQLVTKPKSKPTVKPKPEPTVNNNDVCVEPALSE